MPTMRKNKQKYINFAISHVIQELFFWFYSLALLSGNKIRNLSLFLAHSLFLILLPEHVPRSLNRHLSLL